MTDILVLYYTRNGSTENLAKQIARGIHSVDGARARVRTVPGVSADTQATVADVPPDGAPFATLQDLEECDGLIIGSPTRFGNMAAPLKYFLDSTGGAWAQGTLEGKPAAVFTSTSSMHGGQESTLLAMSIPLLHHGMLLVGVPYSVPELASTRAGGTPYGASHLADDASGAELTPEEATIAKALGQRVADVATRLAQGPSDAHDR